MSRDVTAPEPFSASASLDEVRERIAWLGEVGAIAKDDVVPLQRLAEAGAAHGDLLQAIGKARDRHLNRAIVRTYFRGSSLLWLNLTQRRMVRRMLTPQRSSSRPVQRGVRSRRVVRRVASGDGPARQDEPPEPDLAPPCPRCGSGVVVLRGIRTCGACWAYFTLALEERLA
jgi:hypothetical protein